MSGFFDSINARVSLRNRMRILSILMVVPVAITGWLLYRSHMEVVDFARSEEAGALLGKPSSVTQPRWPR